MYKRHVACQIKQEASGKYNGKEGITRKVTNRSFCFPYYSLYSQHRKTVRNMGKFRFYTLVSSVLLILSSAYGQGTGEQLGRGVVAVRMTPDTVMVGWRYLSGDAPTAGFDVFRDGVKVNDKPVTVSTTFYDYNPSSAMACYMVRLVGDTCEAMGGDTCLLPADAPCGYINIPLQQPAEQVMPDGTSCFYSPNDASVGDVDGDGVFEIILKWDPSNSKDNAHSGFTGTVLLDAYKTDGRLLWRINLGKNIRAGAHYTQFMVYDLDGDGRAELVAKTADGTTDGVGQVIGDSLADWREMAGDSLADEPRMAFRPEMRPEGGDSVFARGPRPEFNPQGGPQGGHAQGPRREGGPKGRILSGSEYLTIFDGATGRALQTIDYIPQRGEAGSWGDTNGNRSERYLAAVAFLDGKRPSVVMCRGYYTRAVLAAFDWDGEQLTQRWVFDTDSAEWASYASQGNHNLRVADVDGDGCDEITYGSCCIDHDGTGLYNTEMGHGDAIHLTAFDPSSDKLYVWDCHENRRDGSDFRDAMTGEIIFQIPAGKDVGRCMAADIDPTNYGLEMWSSASGGIRNLEGEVVCAEPKGLPINMAVWWDGDLLREMLDHETVSKYDWTKGECITLQHFDDCSFNNGTKSNPCLQGDILGDWREEVVTRTTDNMALRIYVSTIPTQYRFHTFLEDRTYRISIVTENVAYNQPTESGFYFGAELEGSGKTFRGYQFDNKH